MEDNLTSVVSVWRKRLDGLLRLEEDKFERFPIRPDLYPEWGIVQAQPYVSQGMNVLEQVLKCLHFRSMGWEYYQEFLRDGEHKLKKGHALYRLWGFLSKDDRNSLRGGYQLWRERPENGVGVMPFRCLDEFLIYLDGEKGKGSINWRYFSIDGRGFHSAYSQGGFTVYESPPTEMLTATISLLHASIERGLMLLWDHGG